MNRQCQIPSIDGDSELDNEIRKLYQIVFEDAESLYKFLPLFEVYHLNITLNAQPTNVCVYKQYLLWILIMNDDNPGGIVMSIEKTFNNAKYRKELNINGNTDYGAKHISTMSSSHGIRTITLEQTRLFQEIFIRVNEALRTEFTIFFKESKK